MTLSKRNRRQITVDGTTYDWTVGARSQAETDRVQLLVHPPDPGQRLSIEIPSRDHFASIGESAKDHNVCAVTPKLVRQLIQFALFYGWTPAESKPQFDIACLIATLSDEGGESGATCHVCWQCPTCDQGYSEDVEFGAQPPLMVECGRRNHHPNGDTTIRVLFW